VVAAATTAPGAGRPADGLHGENVRLDVADLTVAERGVHETDVDVRLAVVLPVARLLPVAHGAVGPAGGEGVGGAAREEDLAATRGEDAARGRERSVRDARAETEDVERREGDGIRGVGFLAPTEELKPSTWPISWSVTLSKSMRVGSTPLAELVSNVKALLKPMFGGLPKFASSAAGFATASMRPSARSGADAEMTLTVPPMSVGTWEAGSRLYRLVSAAFAALVRRAVRRSP
jgi:hypothetical protein